MAVAAASCMHPFCLRVDIIHRWGAQLGSYMAVVGVLQVSVVELRYVVGGRTRGGLEGASHDAGRRGAGGAREPKLSLQ